MSSSELPKQRSEKPERGGTVATETNRDIPKSHRGYFPLHDVPDPKRSQPIKVLEPRLEKKQLPRLTDLRNEIIEARTEFSRTFKQDDTNHVTVISSVAQNFKDHSGKWQPIAPKLSESGSMWKSQGDQLSVLIPQQWSEQSVPIVDFGDGTKVSWSMPRAGQLQGKQRSPEVKTFKNAVGQQIDASPEVVYKQTPGDFEVILQPVTGGLKETIRLASVSAPHRFEFALSLRGLNAVLIGEDVVFEDQNGQAKGLIPKGFMSETTGTDRQSSRGVKYDVVGERGAQRLVVTLDEQWLAKPGLKYPIDVDPTVIKAPAAQAINVSNTSVTSGSDEIRVGTWKGRADTAAYLRFGGGLKLSEIIRFRMLP